ncbi:MAG TPA: HU family DNA-binding protein [Phycisphaerales bacterium]|nr:HU family DNA-binding protein [Phycisphaerales bacterium]
MAKKAAPAAKAAPKPAKLTASAKPRKKSELFTIIAEHAGISRKQVAGVFDAMGKVMAVDLAKPAAGKPKMFVVPGMMRIKAEFKAAVPARKGIDPFTKTEKMFKAKPASTRLKIRPLKALKAMV